MKLPFCSYFEETKNNVSARIFGTWLKTADNDTINMLVRVGEQALFEEDEAKHAEKDPDSTEDNVVDFFCLSALALGWEVKNDFVTSDMVGNAMQSIYFLTVFEDLARKGLCKIKGEYSILNAKSMKMELTQEGKIAVAQHKKEIADRLLRKNGQK